MERESQEVIPVDGTTLFSVESVYKYMKTHIEVLNQCISKSTDK